MAVDRKLDTMAEKMQRARAMAPQAPSKLALVEHTVPASTSRKRPETFSQKTLSAKLAEADYNSIEEVILRRKRAGEKTFNNKKAAREMVAFWLKHHGVEPFDYEAGN